MEIVNKTDLREFVCIEVPPFGVYTLNKKYEGFGAAEANWFWIFDNDGEFWLYKENGYFVTVTENRKLKLKNIERR